MRNAEFGIRNLRKEKAKKRSRFADGCSRGCGTRLRVEFSLMDEPDAGRGGQEGSTRVFQKSCAILYWSGGRDKICQYTDKRTYKN